MWDSNLSGTTYLDVFSWLLTSSPYAASLFTNRLAVAFSSSNAKTTPKPLRTLELAYHETVPFRGEFAIFAKSDQLQEQLHH